MLSETVLLSTAYFPPVQYFSKMLQFRQTLIEVYENYSKQSYRNRCVIYAANGPLTLSIPVVKEHGKKSLTKDVRIEYDTNWQKLHFKSIESAYRSSPFYEFYIDDLMPFFQKKFDFLIDFNTQILHVILDHLDISEQIFVNYTHDYIETLNNQMFDYRDSIHPKKNKNKPDPFFKAPVYMQVFEDKHAFQPNLSILDLFFNEGSLALTKLRESIVKIL